MDSSGLVLALAEWLAFWRQQVRLYENGLALTLEGVRAWCRRPWVGNRREIFGARREHFPSTA